jgi:hypothetical protein
VTSVQKSENLILCRKRLSPASLNLSQTVRSCNPNICMSAGADGNSDAADTEVKVLGYAFDILGGNLNYLMVLKAPSAGYNGFYGDILGCFRESTGHPTGVLEQAVLQACAAVVYETLD